MKLFIKEFCVLLVGAALISGCSERRLPNGYKYVMLNTYSAVITSSTNSIVVDSNVTEYESMGSLVVGYREKEKSIRNNQQEDNGSGYGYFILDTKTGKVASGISVSELAERMEGGS